MSRLNSSVNWWIQRGWWYVPNQDAIELPRTLVSTRDLLFTNHKHCINGALNIIDWQIKRLKEMRDVLLLPYAVKEDWKVRASDE